MSSAYATKLLQFGQAVQTGVLSLTVPSTTSASVFASGLQLRSGNTVSGTVLNQIQFQGTNSQNAHCIRSRHNATSTSDNALDVFIWQYGTDFGTVSGSKPALTIAQTGMGIGNLYPSYPLDVSGSARLTGGLVGSISGNNIWLNIAQPPVGSNAAMMFGSVSGIAGYLNIVSPVGASASWSTDSVVGDSVIRQQTGSLRLYAGNGSGPATMVLAQSGNVGIGQSSPSYSLDVSGTGRFTQTLYSNTGQSSAISFDNASYLQAKNTSGTAEGFLWPRFSDNVTYMNYGSSGFNIRNNASVGTMFLSNNNQVGINTATPLYTLDVSGTGRFTQTLYSSTGQSSAMSFDNASYLQAKNSSGTAENFLWPRYLDNITYINYGSSGFNIRNNASIGTMFLSNNNQVGINTATPLYTLHVEGNVGFANSTDNTSMGCPQMGFFKKYGFPNSLCAANDMNLILGHISNASSAGGIFGSNATATLTQQLVITPTGSVGIATTSPAYTLDIAGPTRFGTLTNTTIGTTAGLVICHSLTSFVFSGSAPSTIDFNYTGASQGNTTFFNSGPNPGGRLVVNDDNYGAALRWQSKVQGVVTNALNERFTILGSGNVGINNSTPSYGLDVTGTARVTGTLNAGCLNSSWVSAAPFQSGVFPLYAYTTLSSPAQIVRTSGGSQTGILFSVNNSGATDAAGYHKGAILFAGVNSNSGVASSLQLCCNTLTDSSNASSANAVLTATPAGVGILTTSPAYALDVSGTARATGNLISNNAQIGDVGFGSLWAGFAATGAFNTTNFALISNTSSGQTMLNAASGSSINFRLGGSVDQGVWTSTGLGVKTTTPAYPLDVVGTSRSTSQVLTNGNVYYATLSSSSVNQILFSYSGGGYSHAIKSRHDSGAAVTNAIDFWMWNYGVDTQTSGPSRPVMSICGSGVGINTFTPQYSFDVSGQVRAVSNGARQITVSNTSITNTSDACEVYFDRSAGTSTAVSAIGVGAGGRGAYWWVNQADRINVNASGNVGINNASPAYTLDVGGSARVTGAVTASGGGALSGTFNWSTVGSSNGLTWGTGPFTKIVDDGDLRIATDDNMHFYIGLNSASYGTERMTLNASGLTVPNQLTAGTLSMPAASTFTGYISQLNADNATFAAGPYTNDWFRVNGNNGIYWQTWGGGWYMFDTTWMRTYNDKNIWAGNGWICCNGRMGIGTSAPAASLEITNNVNYADGADTYFGKGSTGLLQGGGANQATAVHASSRIVTDSAFCAASDRRIKDNILPRNPAEDLLKLQQLTIVRFSYRDVIGHGEKSQIGVIAQDVEDILPECVVREPGPVPDVYETMAVEWVDEHNFSVEWNMEILPSIDSRLRVIAGTTTLIAKVIGLQGSTVALRTSQPHSCTQTCDRVFVWGTFVDDLRNVEYDNLACLNISATQALIEMVHDLQTENNGLRSSLNKIEARLAAAGL